MDSAEVLGTILGELINKHRQTTIALQELIIIVRSMNDDLEAQRAFNERLIENNNERDKVISDLRQDVIRLRNKLDPKDRYR
jgi:cell division protein FtsB